jgi:NADH-quinone oxidoreductase subunit A
MNALFLLAQQAPSMEPRAAWAPVLLLLVIAIGFAVGNLVLSGIIGPSRTGPGKETTYESGMVPIGNTQQRFNVRFYIVAMIFLVFDVEIVFMYPWAS